MSTSNLRTRADIQNHLRTLFTRHSKRAKRPRLDQDQKSSNEEGESNIASHRENSPSPTTPSPLSIINEANYDADAEGDGEDHAAEPENDQDLHIPHPIYSKGTIVYEDEFYKVHVKATAHKRFSKYRLSDHIFNVWITSNIASPPLIFDLELVIETALMHILDQLKDVYQSRLNQNQIYITVVDKSILNGLNSGNYSLATPSKKIVRWVLSMLYNYLKSNQTLQLNPSFKIQIKVLSSRHVLDLEKNRPNFRRHTYH